MAKEDKYKKLTTPMFRAAFPQLFEPKGFEGQNPKYNVIALFDANADISALKQMAKETAEAAWKDGIPTGCRSPFMDGNNKPDLEGYAGMTYVNFKSSQKPGVVDKNVQPILDQSDIYGGMWGRATVTCYAYGKGTKLNPNVSPGVAFGLQNFQKLKDDDAFSGRARAEDDFEPLDIEGEAPQGATASSGGVFD
jgi:hypothetical protein